jgi:gamma-glutamylputrescine oxidase
MKTASADVCIIGAGLAGLSAALHLAEAGKSVIVVEARSPGYGASGRNGGMALLGFQADPRLLLKTLPFDRVKTLWDLTVTERAHMRERLAPMAHRLRAGLFIGAQNAAQFDDLRDMAKVWARLGYTVRELSAAEGEKATGISSYMGGMFDPESFSVNPQEYVRLLADLVRAKGVTVIEDASVSRCPKDGRDVVHHTQGAVQAQNIFIATDAYGAGLNPWFRHRVALVQTSAVRTAPLPPGSSLLQGARLVYEWRELTNYYRLDADNCLVFGTACSINAPQAPVNLPAVLKEKDRLFPQLKDHPIAESWSGQVSFTANAFPIVREVGPGVFLAGGYSGHGVVAAQLAGRLVAEAIRGECQRFDLFAKMSWPFIGGSALVDTLFPTCFRWWKG